MFSPTVWDGLAKIATYKIGDRQTITPTLFPVVDPSKKSIDISKLKVKFGFNQVITSAYLMSKRMGEKPVEEYPDVHEYLNFDGIIMMDSGAYQMMMYGDIELGVLDTIKIQSHVKTDIGVIMDHPISYKITRREAKTRVNTTIDNILESIPYLDKKVKWTLPIQGGKFTDIMHSYIQRVKEEDIFPNFEFYALGSVVPVMINQDYSTLVKMIVTARENIPITHPLHLFGAGHPSMFALATFLGCDTFDSAAYILMAKENRYMTVNGTYQLDNIREFPCICPVCSSYTPDELRAMETSEKTRLLAEHNLWVSIGEIKQIHNAIRQGSLWDLVLQRANSVPNLTRATRLALEYVKTGKLSKLFRAGTPVSKPNSLKVTRIEDINKPELIRVREQLHNYYKNKIVKKLVIITYSMQTSIFNSLSLQILYKLEIPDDVVIALHLPPFGIVPYTISDIYPIGQIVHELNNNDFPLYYTQQIRKIQNLDEVIILHHEEHQQFINSIESLLSELNIKYKIIEDVRPNIFIQDLFADN